MQRTEIKVELENTYVDPKAPALITETLAKIYHALPYKIVDNNLYVAMEEPSDLQAVKSLRFASRHFVVPVLALGSRLNDFIEYHYRLLELEKLLTDLKPVPAKYARIEYFKDTFTHLFKTKSKDRDLLTAQQSKAIIRIIDLLIKQAVHLQASDIHIEPCGEWVHVRFRVSGLLRNIIEIPMGYYPVIVNRIKVMAKLNMAEKKKPQDGSIHIDKEDMRVSLRVSSIASVNREKLVIRVLSKSQFRRSESEIGFSKSNLLIKKAIMKNSQGIIIAAGPTGSGKTTTLYALLREMNDSKYNLVTIEDPVEYQLKGVTQIPVTPKQGMTFANILRSVLRQDPDVILLGEIRDRETAEIAFTASITGHLILTSIHTNDTVSTITRLINLGVDPHFIAASLKGIIAQRLISSLCPHCKEPYEADNDEMEFLQIHEKIILFKAHGCDFCQHTGYHGRLVVYEILEVNREIRQLIEAAETGLILEKACGFGTETLFAGCREHVLNGSTSIEELYRTSYQI